MGVNAYLRVKEQEALFLIFLVPGRLERFQRVYIRAPFHLQILRHRCVWGRYDCIVHATRHSRARVTMHRFRSTMTLLRVAFVVVMSAAASSTVNAVKFRPWRQVPYNPWSDTDAGVRVDHRMATTEDGSVWMFGGKTDGENMSPRSDDLFKLDIAVPEWLTITGSGLWPAERSEHAMTAVGNNFFVHGGSTAILAFSDDFFEFDAATMQWNLQECGQDCPSGRFGHGMVRVGRKILLFGGRVDLHTSGFSDQVWEYDTTTKRWTMLHSDIVGNGTSVPSARCDFAMAAADTKIFVHGGTSEDVRYLGDLWQFDSVENEWALLDAHAGVSGTVPSGRSLHVMTIVDTTVLLFGGLVNSDQGMGSVRPTNGFWQYDINTMEWRGEYLPTPFLPEGSTPPPPPTPQGPVEMTNTRIHGHAATLVGTNLFMYGGRRRSFSFVLGTFYRGSSEFWQFDLSKNSWIWLNKRKDQLLLAPPPHPGLQSHAMVTVGHKVLLHGGNSNKFPSPRIRTDWLWEYDTITMEFVRLTDFVGTPPSARSSHASTSIGSLVLLHGGWTGPVQSSGWVPLSKEGPLTGGVLSDEFWQYCVSSRTWTQLMAPNMPLISSTWPSRRYQHTMTTVGNKVFLFGGRGSSKISNELWEFTVDTGLWRLLDASAGVSGPSPSPRYSHAMSSVDKDKFMIFGGMDCDTFWYLSMYLCISLSHQEPVDQEACVCVCVRAC